MGVDRSTSPSTMVRVDEPFSIAVSSNSVPLMAPEVREVRKGTSFGLSRLKKNTEPERKFSSGCFPLLSGA